MDPFYPSTVLLQAYYVSWTVHAQPIHDCENVIQMSIYEWCDSNYEWLTSPPIFLFEICRNVSSWISRQSFGPIKKFGFDLHTSEFFHWSRANMDWTIDIYGDNHNCQVESLKWTLNHTINGFHGFNKWFGKGKPSAVRLKKAEIKV